ncbi:hydrolase, partial [Candidatus Bathyarchaeota archaeon]|nr:hydrolase [Candidatus Bathyarchaeota archaeon]
MPFTPYHPGPGLFVGLLFLGFIDFPTFLVASVIVDVEPLLVLAFNLNYPLHGFFHSFLGGTLVAVPLALAMYKIRGKFSPLLSFFRLEQTVSLKKVLAAAL